ncbi:MAG: hypothetical protein J5761_04765 [Paludibacteraceae bacterium]|nr:hypothetical protein [Paludibacteraceae bacterium]
MAKTRTIILLGLAILFASCNTPEPQPTKNVVDQMPKSAKRGVAFSFTQVTDLPLLSPYISWDYNWGNTPTDEAATWFDANEMDFCPMCWNGNYSADKIRTFVAAHPKTQYLLAFNEPNLTDQANMTPAKAAELWPPVVALAKELNLKLVSPAMNYGTLAGYNDPIKWLDEFFAQPGVSIDDIYAISIHCYMSSASSVQGYVEKFEKYNKPIWMTEFCAWDPIPGSVNTQMDYMCSVLNYLEKRPSVERYAWFIPRTSGKVDSAPYMQLLTHDYPAELTELGKMYCYFSPMDESVWLRTTRPILAGEYVSVANNAMPLRPSTDAEVLQQVGHDGLMVTNFAQGQSISYQLYLPQDGSQITLRYCGYSNSICEILVDGESKNFLEMPRNGSSTEWTAASISLPVKAGCHTITLTLFSGSCYLSALILQ